MKILLVGSTGLVGGHVLDQALADARVTQVVALTRRAMPARPKLEAPIVDFDRLPEDAPWWKADAVICTLGTTMKVAGSKEAFLKVDHHYPLVVGRLAHRHGTPTYVLNSALGADARSMFFYSRVKGELERDLAAVGFRSLTLVRPGVIGGDRQETRVGERMAIVALGTLAPVVPKKWRINPAETIAKALIEAATKGAPGVHIVGSEALV